MGSDEADRDLFGEPVPKAVPEKPGAGGRWRFAVSPHAWFTIPSGRWAAAAQVRNVLAGLHPFGRALSDAPGALCGNCEHLFLRGGNRDYWKCRLNKVTSGPGTDVRVKWRACSEWKVAAPGRSVPRARPAPSRAASGGLG